MSEANDLDYYRQRERTAREHATAASEPSIAAIHSEMADRYAALIVEKMEDDMRSSPKLTLKTIG